MTLRSTDTNVLTATRGRAEVIIRVAHGPYLGEAGTDSWACDASTFPECIEDAPVLTDIRLHLTPQ